MCGIAGILRYQGPPPEAEEIRDMTSALAHRGPDGSGVHLRGPVALGHARLAIIDIAGGAQPMFSPDNSLAVVFNGEIYNFLELRRELEQSGCVFTTNSDTEVLLHGWARWGEELPLRLNGMFAFALADFDRRRIFLARDHAGVKPLFYRTGPGWFAFASELHALRRVRAPAPRGCLQSVDFFLRYQYIPSPRTIYDDAFKLPPAHCMAVDFDGLSTPPRRYWRLSFGPPLRGTDEDIAAAATDEFAQAVKRCMISDAPLGLFCSGGLDSTAVAGYAAGFAQQPLKAFTIGFEEAGYSEIPWAEKAAKGLGLDLRAEIVRGESLDMLPELVRHYGEPFGDSSAVPTFHLSRLARREAAVVLSGDGGDELFGGYGRYFIWKNAGLRTRYRPKTLRAEWRAGRFRKPSAVRDALGFGPGNWARFVTFFGYPERKTLWRPDLVRLADADCPLFSEAHAHAADFSGMAYPQSMDFETYLPGDILTKVDVATMFHGLEARPVFLDRLLMEFAARLPDRLKYDGGSTGKLILQRIVSQWFPPDFVRRPKQGFGIPRLRWLSPGGSGRGMVEELLLSTSSPLRRWFDAKSLAAHATIGADGENDSGRLWLLLVLGLWAEQNPDVSFDSPA